MRLSVSRNLAIKKNIQAWFIFLILTLLLFWPILHKSFASDDFVVLYRIIYQKNFFTQDFFRPLSDISLYGSYLTAGLNVFYFNVANVLIHASCAFLLYKFCLIGNFIVTGNTYIFAWFTAILFVIYPFHNEAVIWAIGRGIVLSGFFGFLSLLVVFTKLRNVSKYPLSCLFYFIGLCGYETIFPLPAIILILLYTKNKSIKNLLTVAMAYFVTLCANIALRLYASGNIGNSYGSKMFSSSLTGYFVKLFKAAGRLLLPPSQFSLLLGICFVAVAGLIGFAFIAFVKKKDEKSFDLFKLTIITILSCVIPVMFGVSTKTFEGDRVLYFSSFFLCIWISYFLSFIQNDKLKKAIGLLVVAYFLFFFYQSVLAWKKSGNTVNDILQTVSGIDHACKNLYLLNIPEEYDGAPIFRNGFTEALLLNHLDTAGVKIVSYITTDAALKISGTIKPADRQQGLFIYPGTFIGPGTITSRVHMDKSLPDSIHVQYDTADNIYYWNKKSLILLQRP